MAASKIEVLAPAGGWDSLEAAVRAGADAVYLGGRAFGARANAKNFDRDELRQAVEYCHRRDVRVHVTVNTLLKDTELPEALDFVEYLCSLPVDAVLVQDMGLLRLLRERAPALPLHASTQMSLHTPAGVRLARELGLARAVLARELSLPEIHEISESCPIELESFVHGALCMCVSGQCYLSAMLGGRSGNRGQCAQPCRLAFAAPGGTGHDLSLKDLSFIESMAKLEQAGVCSAKIEGRMKRPEYVAAATAACRLAADGQPVPGELSQALRDVFSRSGFTDGYLTGNRGREMFGTRRKEDVLAGEKALSGLRGLYRAERQKLPVDFRLQVSREQGSVILTARNGRGAGAFAAAKAAAEITESSTPRERAEQQLRKTGGTPFFTRDVDVPEDVPLPVSGLNQLRRTVLDALLEAGGNREPVPFQKIPLDFPGHERRTGKLPVRAVVRTPDQVCPALDFCREIALPVEWEPERLNIDPARIILELPRAAFGREKQLRKLMEKRMAAGFSRFLCGNLGMVQLCRELGAEPHGGPSLNIANTAALEEFQRLGLASAEVSMELSGKEIAGLGGGLARGITVYGRQALMLTRNCPLANSRQGGLQGCLHCKTPGFLTDRKGLRFPVVCRQYGAGGVELLNSVPLWLGDQRLDGVDFSVLRFTVENPVEISRVAEAFHAGESLGGDYTRGLFRRGVE